MKKRKVPRLATDEDAEKFLEQDLSDLDFSQFKPVRFEFERKDARLNMRVPLSMMRALKSRAKARGIPYQRFIREALEQTLGASQVGGTSSRRTPMIPGSRARSSPR